MKNIQVRVEDKLKDDADQLFKDLGTTTNEAIKVFLQMSLNKRGFPFEIKLPEIQTMEERVLSKMLPLTDEDIEDTYKFVEGSFYRNSDFDKAVFEESILIKGILHIQDYSDDSEIELAEARLLTVDGSMNDFWDVADSISGDLEMVASIMKYELDVPETSKIGIIDEFFVYSLQASANTRIELLKNYIIPYLKDRGVEYVGFMNPGLWRTESLEERKSLNLALENSDLLFWGQTKSEKWTDIINVIEI